MYKAWEVKTFDYVINFWFGPRSTKKKYKYDPKTKQAKKLQATYGQWYNQIHHYYLVNAHCKFLKKHNINNLQNIVFVINEWEEQDTNQVVKEVKEVVNWYGLDNKIKVITHDNTNHSYGAWNRGIKQLIKDKSNSNFVFVCEDDYLPTDGDFFKPFFHKFNDKIGYVAQHIDNVKYHINETKEGVGRVNTHHSRKHAAVSNGFIDFNLAKTLYNKHKEIFTFNLSEYSDANLSTRAKEQIIFADNILNEGYKLETISDICSVPFDIENNNRLKYFGNIDNYCPIKPYQYGLANLSSGNKETHYSFRDMDEKDLEWFLEIRNDDTTRHFLLNNNQFNIDEAREWFNNLDKTLFPYQVMSRVERKYVLNDGNYTKQKYDYFEVELPVGYTRRYMREIDGEKIIELGCDIHPTFRKKGFARQAYIHMLSSLDAASLWVFEDNFARNLYFELGFRDNGKTKINRGRKEYQMIWRRKN